MTVKHVKLSKDVHEKLVYLKKKTNTKTINDVIYSLIQISEEFYTNDGTLKVSNKKVSFKYTNGKLVEIQIEVNKY